MEQSDADDVRGRINGTLDYGDFADCDLVIEAITEDLRLKLEMWREVDGIVKDGAPCFATNTSSLSVIDQAAATERPDRFIGLHFFNPAQVMPLLEVVRTVTTSDEAFDVDRLRVSARSSASAVNAQGQDGLHRQPPAGAVHARRDPRLRGGRRLGRRDRRGDEGRRGAPDGPVHAARLRRPRHDSVDLRRHVRRVPRAPLRRSRRRCARWSPPAGTARRAGWASTTTPATSRCRTRSWASRPAPGPLARARTTPGHSAGPCAARTSAARPRG